VIIQSPRKQTTFVTASGRATRPFGISCLMPLQRQTIDHIRFNGPRRDHVHTDTETGATSVAKARLAAMRPALAAA
jgi:hypothetical protein